MLAGATFTGTVVNSIVPTALQAGSVVLAATEPSTGGVWRSTDSAKTFTLISGTPALAGGGVSSLVADPTTRTFFMRPYPPQPSSPVVMRACTGVLTEG